MQEFGLNHVSLPGMDWAGLVSIARELGCVGVELRNDLQGALFGGDAPEHVRSVLSEQDMRLVALAQIGRFNDLDEKGLTDAAALIDTARRAGAEGVALIPKVGDGPVPLSQTSAALERLGPILEDAGLRGFVEPVGFATSSLRRKEDTLAAIEAAGGGRVFALIHDTFHHYLAGETQYFAAETSLAHVSGVERDVSADKMADADRVLVGRADRLGTLAQVRNLARAGFAGPISIEAFSPSIQRLTAPKEPMARCLAALRGALQEEIPVPVA